MRSHVLVLAPHPSAKMNAYEQVLIAPLCDVKKNMRIIHRIEVEFQQ